MKIDNELLKLNSNVLSRRVRKDPTLTSLFMTTFYWAENLLEALYCGKSNIVEFPQCEYPGCNLKKKFLTSCGHHQYAKGCCTQHSSRSTSLEKHGIEIPQRLDSVKNKTKETNLEKYGSIAPVGSPAIFAKMRKTSLERFGTEYAAQSDSIKDRNKKLFLQKTVERVCSVARPMFEDYESASKEYPWRCNRCDSIYYSTIRTSYRDVPRCPICWPKRSSLAETEIGDYIESLGFTTVRNSRKLFASKEIDIFVPSKKLAVEYNGLYWHSEGRNGNTSTHLDKTDVVEDMGCQLIHVFEDEWTNKKDIVQSIISAKLGVFQDKVFARKCSIVEVSSNKARSFFNTNHIQGYVPSKINFGLVFNNDLVCCMSFGKSRYNREVDWELLRFANKLHSQCIGGSSRLLKHFIHCINPNSIISYADRRYSTGNMYKRLGFEFSHKSNPSYSYFRNGYPYRESRIKYQKHKIEKILPIFTSSKTEWENMLDNGYNRIWDCGNLVYLWRSSLDLF